MLVIRVWFVWCSDGIDIGNHFVSSYLYFIHWAVLPVNLNHTYSTTRHLDADFMVDRVEA